MFSSPSSSRSVSPEAVETIQIFVKTIVGDSESILDASHLPSRLLTNGAAIPLTIPRDTSIANLITLLSLRTSCSEKDLRLVHAGKHLSPSTTLDSNRIARDSTLHLALPLRGGMPPKKIRCTAHDCKETAQRIVGDCGFCNGHFCGKHRLLEDHKCTGLEDVSRPPYPAFASIARVAKPKMCKKTKIARFGSLHEKKIQWWLVGLDPELIADMSA